MNGQALGRLLKVATRQITSSGSPRDGKVFTWGSTVPTDGDEGYAKGCLFVDTDAAVGSIFYINEGTVESADFNAFVALTAAQEALLTAVAGTVTASKAVIVDANKDASGFNDITVGSIDTDTAEALVIGASTATALTLAASDIDTKVLGTLTMKTAHGGLLAGAGTSGTKSSLGATAGNALSFYLDGTHTTGDMRGQYLRLYFSGAGGSGEAARIFSTINNVSVATGGTVNGAHISIGTAGASAAVSGAANALRCTFGIAAASTNIGGTCSVIQVDTDLDTAVTVPSNFAFLRFTNTNTKKSNNLMRVPDVVAEAGGLFCAHTTQTMTHSLKIVSEDGTAYYVMCTNANTNRTES